MIQIWTCLWLKQSTCSYRRLSVRKSRTLHEIPPFSDEESAYHGTICTDVYELVINSNSVLQGFR